MSNTKISSKKFQLVAVMFIISAYLVNGQNISSLYHHPENASLNAILVNGDSIDNFEQHLNTFKINLPYSTVKSPNVSATSEHSGDIIRIFPASNVFGSEKERTVRILVSSKDKSVTETYKLVFTVLPKLDLFLLIGQSNMAGRGTISSDYLDSLADVFLLTPHACMETAMNPLNKYSNIRKDLKMQQIGPGYEFSKKIVAETGSHIGLIVNARGGSSITSWEKGSKDQYYEKTLSRMKTAMKWGDLKAILWHQGETDSGHPETYLKKLSVMVENLRTDLGYPKVLFVAGELAYWRNDSKVFNKMIKSISVLIPSSTWVSAEGLTPLINNTDPHFDVQSQLILGERYADKVLQFCYGR